MVLKERVRGHLRRSKLGVPHPVRSYQRKPPVFYHVTSDYRLPLIMERGLIPSGPETGSNYPWMRRRGRVYLANDPKTVKFFGTDAPGDRKGSPVVLEVNARGIPVERDPHEVRYASGAYRESAVYQPIPPGRLRVLPTWFPVVEDVEQK